MALQKCFAIVLLLVIWLGGVTGEAAAQSVSAYDLINLINGMRSANGLGALSTDASLMACAQSTAETMAAAHMTWHIGNVSGRASSFGYNNYNTCFATENFMMGAGSTTISQIQAAWSDATHMIPATSSSYCHIGAGVAAAGDGMYYYVVQAAYPAGSAGCSYQRSSGSASGSSGAGAAQQGTPLFIRSVVTSTPDADGLLYHTVDEGQTLWSISEAYGVTIEDIQGWNNLYSSTALSVGQQLYIPSKAQSGRTPTPQTALTVFPTADASGRFYHEVGEGDTLWAISELWNVSLNAIYQANGLTEDSSIGLGWRIIIPVTPTATLPPTETPTATLPPTETPTPTVETLMTTGEPNPETGESETGNSSGTFLHMPHASAKTYVILGALGITLIGGILVGVGIFMKKK